MVMSSQQHKVYLVMPKPDLTTPASVAEDMFAEDEQANFVTEFIKETTASKVAIVCGLANQPEHNGAKVKVMHFDDERGRFKVDLPNGEKVFIKGKNLQLQKAFEQLPDFNMSDFFSASRQLPFYNNHNLQRIDTSKIRSEDLTRLFHHFRRLGI